MMCSIFGAVGTPDPVLLEQLREAAKDRGRDGGRVEWYTLQDSCQAVLGNWRATPTPEPEKAPLQPYDLLVHNGTIANDKELGALPGEVDSQVLARVLDRSSVSALVASLHRVRGSYALALASSRTVLLACNYKPIHYWSPDGQTAYFSSLARHFKSLLPWGQAPMQLTPYSALDLRTKEHVRLPRECPRRALVIASAGLDSTVVATHLQREGYEVRLLHFLYGCRAEGPESNRIPAIAEALGCTYELLELPFGKMRGGSPLLTEAPISGGVEGAEFAHEWVPARNLVMLALATAYAEANGFGYIALGNNLEESGAYPDNEEQFTLQLDALLDYAVADGREVRVLMPVANLMKHEIVALGVQEKAPLQLTWSCYRNGQRHCGQCGPCFMRRTAFERNGLQDPVFT